MSNDADTISLATELTVAWLANPNTRVSSDEVPAFLASVHEALGKLSSVGEAPPIEAAAPEYTPAVTARKSLASPEHIISMIDGKPYRTLKRHLATNGLTPAEYRQRYNLKADYPMVAPAYSEARRETAKRLGLGRKPAQQAAEAAPASEAKPRKRRSASEAKAAAKAHLGGDKKA